MPDENGRPRVRLSGPAGRCEVRWQGRSVRSSHARGRQRERRGRPLAIENTSRDQRVEVWLPVRQNGMSRGLVPEPR